ncbi:MAG: hypothetical protein ACOC1X_02850 [Promethearchaeota archaeon]
MTYPIDNKKLLLEDEFYEATREPHSFIESHYKEVSNDILCLALPASKEYVESIIEVKEGKLDEGKYEERWRIKKPKSYVAPKNVDWDNPSYEKFLFVNYDNFNWIDLRKKFWLAFDYWLKVETIKKHTPQSDLYGLEQTSGEFTDYEEN